MIENLEKLIGSSAETAAGIVFGFGSGMAQTIPEAKVTIDTTIRRCVEKVIQHVARCVESYDTSGPAPTISDPDALVARIQSLIPLKIEEDDPRTDLRIIADRVTERIDGKLCEAIAELLERDGDREILVAALKAVQDTAASALVREKLTAGESLRKGEPAYFAPDGSIARGSPCRDKMTLEQLRQDFADELNATASRPASEVLRDYEWHLATKLAEAVGEMLLVNRGNPLTQVYDEFKARLDAAKKVMRVQGVEIAAQVAATRLEVAARAAAGPETKALLESVSRQLKDALKGSAPKVDSVTSALVDLKEDMELREVRKLMAGEVACFEDERGVSARDKAETLLNKYEILLVLRLAKSLRLGEEVNTVAKLHDAVHGMQQVMIDVARDIKEIAGNVGGLVTHDRLQRATDRLLAGASCETQ